MHSFIQKLVGLHCGHNYRSLYKIEDAMLAILEPTIKSYRAHYIKD